MVGQSLPVREKDTVMKAIIVNAAVFQVGWLCCMLAGANHHPWLGTLTALLIVACHVSHAVFMPLLMLLSRRLDGTSCQTSRLIAPGCNAHV
jgi:hypothetical protein